MLNKEKYPAGWIPMCGVRIAGSGNEYKNRKGFSMQKTFWCPPEGAVSDYCFLSDPDSSEVFIVERSGRVRRWQEEEATCSPGVRRGEKLPEIMRVPETNWSWLDGYLPVLKADNIMLLASGDFLLCDSDPRFPAALDAVRRRWTRFFDACKGMEKIPDEYANAWKSSFVQAICSFSGRHPHYGVEHYGEFRSDGFPPNILAMAHALHACGHTESARSYAQYYFRRFIRADGTIDYYGASVSEYGKLLHLAALLSEDDGDVFLQSILPQILAMNKYLIDLLNFWMGAPRSEWNLIAGSPEADTREESDEYLHNNLWVLRGWLSCERILQKFDAEFASEIRRDAALLQRRIGRFLAYADSRFDPLPYRVRQKEKIADFTCKMDFAYANYRYYPEMLSSGLLSREQAMRIIEAREKRFGEYEGATVLAWEGIPPGIDNWPIADYAAGLALLGEKERLRKVIQGHWNYAMCHDVFTAYEWSECKGAPRRAYTDWCVPVQLAFPRMLMMLARMP